MIDKNALLDALEDYKDEFGGSCSDFNASARDALCRRVVTTIEDIVNEQTVVKPVKRGRWVHGSGSENIIVTCSECGYKVNYFWDSWQDANYCPNCGAKMDGDVNVFD